MGEESPALINPQILTTHFVMAANGKCCQKILIFFCGKSHPEREERNDNSNIAQLLLKIPILGMVAGSCTAWSLEQGSALEPGCLPPLRSIN